VEIMATNLSWSFLIPLFCFSMSSSARSLPAPQVAGRIPPISFIRSEIVRIALQQSEQASADWNVDNRDCAGFIRYVFSRATHQHTPLWQDQSGHVGAFADAENLIGQNFEPVADPLNKGQDKLEEERIQTGDLLAFYFPQKAKNDRWHLMLLLKTPIRSNRDILVVYHNGAKRDAGQIRKVWLQDLQSAPVAEWRPSSSNANFKGLFRWKGFQPATVF